MTKQGWAIWAGCILVACTDATAGPDVEPTFNAATETAPLFLPPINVTADIAIPEDPYSKFATVLAAHQAMSDRVARISRRLRIANAPLCAVTRPDIGLSTHQLSDYPNNIRPLALHFMDIRQDGRFVRSVVPGSPADQAQLRPGEEVVSGWPVRAGTHLVIDDGYAVTPLRLVPDVACDTPTFVINSDRMNASTDGQEIELSTALVKQVGDDAALALIIAHEMAHVLRAHDPEGPRWTAELQADADALTLMRNAGYNILETVAGWEAGVEAHRESQAMSPTHPPLRIRLRNLESALDRLNAGPEGFRTLPKTRGQTDAGAPPSSLQD